MTVADKKRIEGPTPNGGAYAVMYIRDGDQSGSALVVEVIEYTADGREISRTYGSTPAAALCAASK